MRFESLERITRTGRLEAASAAEPRTQEEAIGPHQPDQRKSRPVTGAHRSSLAVRGDGHMARAPLSRARRHRRRPQPVRLVFAGPSNDRAGSRRVRAAPRTAIRARPDWHDAGLLRPHCGTHRERRVHAGATPSSRLQPNRGDDPPPPASAGAAGCGSPPVGHDAWARPSRSEPLAPDLPAPKPLHPSHPQAGQQHPALLLTTRPPQYCERSLSLDLARDAG